MTLKDNIIINKKEKYKRKEWRKSKIYKSWKNRKDKK